MTRLNCVYGLIWAVPTPIALQQRRPGRRVLQIDEVRWIKFRSKDPSSIEKIPHLFVWDSLS